MSIPGLPSDAPAGAGYGWIREELRGLWRAIRELGPSVAGSVRPLVEDLALKQAALEEQQAYLASLISRDAQIGTFSTGTLTNDSAYHLIGSQIVIPNVPVPTGKVRVTLSCSEASIAPGANSVIAAICFAIDGQWSLDPATKYARLWSPGRALGVSLARIGTEELPPGEYTFRAQAGYWSSGTDSASITFAGLRLLVEVIGAD